MSDLSVDTSPSLLPTLRELCARVVNLNLTSITSFGSMSYEIVRPFLVQMEADQLRAVEENSPHLIEETEDLWRALCIKEFLDIRKAHERGQLELPESWRDLYSDAYAQRETKLEQVQQRLHTNYKSIAADKEDRRIQVIDRAPPSRKRSTPGRSGGSGSGSGSSLMQKTRKAAQLANRHFASTAAGSAYAAPSTSPTRLRPSQSIQGLALYKQAATINGYTSPRKPTASGQARDNTSRNNQASSSGLGVGQGQSASAARPRVRPTMARPPPTDD